MHEERKERDSIKNHNICASSVYTVILAAICEHKAVNILVVWDRYIGRQHVQLKHYQLECRILYSECNLLCALYMYMHAFTAQINAYHIRDQTLFPRTPAHYCQWRCGTPSFSCHCTPGQSGTLHPGGGKGRHICTCPMHVYVRHQSTPISKSVTVQL